MENQVSLVEVWVNSEMPYEKERSNILMERFIIQYSEEDYPKPIDLCKMLIEQISSYIQKNKGLPIVDDIKKVTVDYESPKTAVGMMLTEPSALRSIRHSYTITVVIAYK